MKSSPTNLPFEVAQIIASFVAEGSTLIRLGAVSRVFAEACGEEATWERLYRNVWWNIPRQHTLSYRSDYARRFVLDRSVFQQLQRIAACLRRTCPNQIRDVDLIRLLQRDKSWLHLINNDEYAECMTVPRGMALHQYTGDLCDQYTTCVASITLEYFTLAYISREWNYWLQQSNRNSPTHDSICLEEGAFLLAFSLFDWEKSLNTRPDLARLDMFRRLDELALQLQSRIGLETTASEDPVGATTKLSELLRDLGYGGNVENYYDLNNSSLLFILENRKGIPITLAVLYKCVLRRVGVFVDIIGLPGHVVLGISTNEIFVDVFCGGQVLSVQNCREIVDQYHVEWTDQFLAPVTASNVLLRMTNNMLHCMHRRLAGHLGELQSFEISEVQSRIQFLRKCLLRFQGDGIEEYDDTDELGVRKFQFENRYTLHSFASQFD
ncbi:predicted protein [Phaeodactylum tricornutum CCAP 1055/1]|jgi:hypothetical protein|uniref:Protein SirB1 N-terminal domain-containing protein n=1 Tax=Phaeodactylum tricornutum (strain CCAP 1055/1) TaxID=556484 RepID=B7FSC4_PHATC|nr:predicted protein [Phaeodactylum tricornutum CCAP 1055/1]EEC50453.1 predicted protein [Phaeodactylum tricornutum CCAP 1055/1]|eukprot:XP_002177639.1 predicted protein [Phaeodactylum tricornutum CCAP 1055/1]